ncbi:MAG TPA: PEP-utilizing enzyme, partial [Microbacterium sp.]|nr:PEP-utilizing enzyme [Microbacterium sp.]
TGGLVSHAAVVARGWHLPAVVGAKEIVIEGDAVKVGDDTLRAGDVITIDGTTGEVWSGAHEQTDGTFDAEALLHARLPEFALLEEWAATAGS